MQDLNKIIQDLSAYYDDVGIWYETYAEDIKNYLSDSEKGIKLIDALIDFSKTHKDLSEYIWVAIQIQNHCCKTSNLPDRVCCRALALAYIPNIKQLDLDSASNLLLSDNIHKTDDLYYKVFKEFDINKYRYLIRLQTQKTEDDLYNKLYRDLDANTYRCIRSIMITPEISQRVGVFKSLIQTYNKELVDE